WDPLRVKQIFNADEAEKVQGKSFHRLTKAAKGDPNVPILFMPNDRIIIIAGAPAAQLASLLSPNGTQPVVAPDVVTQVRAVEKATYWATLQITGEMQQMLAILDGKQVEMFPDLKPAVPAVRQLKAVSLTVEQLPTQKTRFR